jgi:ribosome biogenesis GTPase
MSGGMCAARAQRVQRNSEIMIELEFDRLRPIGLTQAAAQSLLTLPCEHGRAMRVTEVQRETVLLHDGVASQAARVLPRLARGLLDRDDAIAVGDWTVAAYDVHGDLWVHAVAPSLNRIVRRSPDGTRHVVVSNVDTALLVTGLDGDFNLRRLERYLAIVQPAQVWPVVVLTKADACADVAAALAMVRERLPDQVAAYALDARDAQAAKVLQPYLGEGQTVVLLGSSGAGKSTLTNTLLGTAVQDTGEVREHDARGKHTTTARSLHRLPGGACLIDTPGLRGLRPDIDEADLGIVFADIAQLAHDCRFRDCTHGDEPDCAVRAGVDADRLKNYQKMLRDLRRDTLTALERRQQLAVWKARGRAGAQRMKMKRDTG